MNVLELVYCLCGELVKKEEIKENEIPVCWRCQCNTNEEVQRKEKKRR